VWVCMSVCVCVCECVAVAQQQMLCSCMHVRPAHLAHSPSVAHQR
jgi:hypothetical protein